MAEKSSLIGALTVNLENTAKKIPMGNEMASQERILIVFTEIISKLV
jgi:hypothetical protein